MSLLALPGELHLHILSLLDYKSFTKFRAITKYFRRLPSKEDIKASLSRYEYEESFADFYSARDFLPCYSCMRMLPEVAFVRKQIRFTRAFGHREYLKRNCFECGLRSDWPVTNSETIRLPDGSWYHFCRQCHHAERKESDHGTMSENMTCAHSLCATCRLSSLKVS